MNDQELEVQKYAAPWGRLLKVSSVVIILLFIMFGFIGQADGHSALWLLPLLLLLALPFVVRGYALSEQSLIIKRLGWNTTFPLDDLQSVEIDCSVMKGSIRMFGNGGLFSFTGLYRNKKWGNYRAFVNDWRKTVVLHFDNRTIVVSPDDPLKFAAALEKRDES